MNNSILHRDVERQKRERELRGLLAEPLGFVTAVPDPEWELIRDLKVAQDYIKGRLGITVSDVIPTARKHLNPQRVSTKPARTDTQHTEVDGDEGLVDLLCLLEGSPSKKTARSVIIAHMARQEQREKADTIRKLVRVPASLTYSEASQWLQEQADFEKANPDMDSVDIASWDVERHEFLKDEDRVFSVLTRDDLEQPFLTTLVMSTDNEPYFAVVPIRRKRGVLRFLLVQAESLYAEYGWTVGQAVSHILCDYMPRISQAKLRYERNRRIPALSRLILDIDPALSPRDVMKIYSEARRIVFPGKDRDMSDQRMVLAAWISQHATDYDDWPARMDAYNKWLMKSSEGTFAGYDDVGRFRWDAKAACDNLLDPKDVLDGAMGSYLVGEMSMQEFDRAVTESRGRETRHFIGESLRL